MNQILETEEHLENSKNSDGILSSSFYYKNKFKTKSNKLKRTYKFVFLFSFTLLIILMFSFISSTLQFSQKENFSQQLVDNYSVLSLYQKNSDYSNVVLENEKNMSVSNICGMLEIPSLKLSYPIFSTLSEEFLKISVCRFWGEMPPTLGNLCIAGHNYENGKFFSSISNLKKEDQINIYDLTYHKYTYSVFDQYEVKTDDLSPLSFNSDSCQLTLVTCNNWNQNRIIIKAFLKSD